ncbi:hypothetical protein [Streptomyces orinoci]|uniref:Lipoprotein n=1 Tax=Streptomyces orinoci TaxID=67339 RepID=A0ABV3K5G7_STRON|nr:hypothetical protein [Streptomyces orinoci]
MKLNMALVGSALVVTVLAAGCGGPRHSDEHKAGKPAASAVKRETEEKRGAAEAGEPAAVRWLAQVELGENEVPGYVVEKAEPGSAGRGRPSTEDVPCRPLVTALGSAPEPRPVASLTDTFTKSEEAEDFEGLLGTIRVSAYRDAAQAGDTFRRLRDSAAACAGGFRMRTGEGENQEFRRVEVLPAPRLGDEAVAYRLDNAVEQAPSVVTVVRSGQSLAMFFATSLGEIREPGVVRVPLPLVAAQVERIRRAGPVWVESGAPGVPGAPDTPGAPEASLGPSWDPSPDDDDEDDGYGYRDAGVRGTPVR